MAKLYKDDETKLRTYRDRIKAAENELDRDAPKIRECIERFANEARQEQFTVQGHRINAPSGVSFVDSIYSLLISVFPQVNVNNVALGTRDQARLATQVVKHVWREQKGKRKAADAIKDHVLASYGFIEVGYEYHEEEVERERPLPDREREVNELYDRAKEDGLPPPDPNLITELVPSTEMVTEATRDRITLEFVPWDEVIYDFDARRWDDIRWVARRMLVPLHELRTNPDYLDYAGKKKLESIQPDAHVKEELRGKRAPNEDDDRVTVFRYYDLSDTGTVCHFTLQGDFLLLEKANPFATNDDLEDRNPLVPFLSRRVPGRVRGLSDMEVILPSLDEENVYRSNLASYLERLKPKILGPEQAFTEAGKTAMQSQEWGEFVPLDGGVSANDVQALNPPPLPQEMFGMIERVQVSMREALGVNEMQRGFFPDRKRTATETGAVMDASTARMADKREALERFYEDIFRRILWLAQRFYDAPRIARIAEHEGDVEWEWTNEDISFEADLEVTLSPERPRTADSRRDDALMWLNYLAPLPVVDQAQLAAYVAEEGGMPFEVVRRVIKLPEEVQGDQAKALEDEAVQQAVSDGMTPEEARQYIEVARFNYNAEPV